MYYYALISEPLIYACMLLKGMCILVFRHDGKNIGSSNSFFILLIIELIILGRDVKFIIYIEPPSLSLHLPCNIPWFKGLYGAKYPHFKCIFKNFGEPNALRITYAQVLPLKYCKHCHHIKCCVVVDKMLYFLSAPSPISLSAIPVLDGS